MQSDFGCILVRFELEFTCLNSRIMMIDSISHGTKLLPQEPGVHELQFACRMPDVIKLRFSGKNPNLDTELDNNGNIINDLCVKIKNFSLDHIDIDWFVVNKIMQFRTESGQEFATNYIGFNGELSVVLDQGNVFDQVMSWRRQHGQ